MTHHTGESVETPRSVDELEEMLSRPPARLLEAFSRLDGDLILLGVGGKMGPTMAHMAHRALREIGSRHKVMGVSRFRNPPVRRRLADWGIETIACDLLDEEQVDQLPDAPLIVAMTGFKFGASSDPALAWATNCYMPALICRKYRHSRIAAFSTGNVYGLVPCTSAGSVETDPVRPQGEYAVTAVGRERMYAYFSRRYEIPMILLRLNYATELRYGVLVDLAQQVADNSEIDLSMSYVNVIWLGDANAMALEALAHTDVPARILNLAGPDILATREVCQTLGDLLGVSPRFTGTEHQDALLNNGQRGWQLLGRPAVSADTMIRWTAEWIARGGETLGKPTHFQSRSGDF